MLKHTPNKYAEKNVSDFNRHQKATENVDFSMPGVFNLFVRRELNKCLNLI